MNEEDAVYTYTMEYLFFITKWNLTICDNLDESRGYYAKWNKSDKDKTVWLHLYLESIKQTKLNQTHRDRKERGGCQRRSRRLREWII